MKTGLSPTEKRIIFVALFLMTACTPFLLSDRWIHLLAGRSLASSNPKIGTIEMMSKDVRHKNARVFEWLPAQKDENLHLGDAIFTGADARAVLNVFNQSKIVMSENSLVRLSSREMLEPINLLSGNFLVEIDGEADFIINQQKVRLSGKKSNVQIYFDSDNKAQFKTIQGHVEITANKKKIVASSRKPSSFANEENVYPPYALPSFSKLIYQWRFEDFYEQQDQNGFQPRKTATTHSSLSTPLTWQDQGQGPYTLEIKSVVENQSQPDKRDLVVEEKNFLLSELQPGLHTWRVSRDKKNWSAQEKILVTSAFLGPGPAWKDKNKNLNFVGDLETNLDWSAPEEAASYILEASRDPLFPADQSAVLILQEKQARIKITEPGNTYYRLRWMNRGQQISALGPVLQVTSTVPALLPAPVLPSRHLSFTLPAKAALLWKNVAAARSYQVNIYSANQQLLISHQSDQNYSVQDLPEGKYFYDVAALDAWGRMGQNSKRKAFEVARPVPLKLAEAPRAPTQDETGTTALSKDLFKEPTPTYLNRQYSHSFINLRGASFGMFSTEQIEKQPDVPLAATASLNVLFWNQSHGVEGSLRSKVFNYNESASSVSPSAIEGRYHYRWNPHFPSSLLIREMQISLFTGLEFYRNANSSNNFVKGYDLLKFGTSLQFPVGNRWSSGGELLAGQTLDQSRKYEISGNLLYFFTKDLAVGLGYRAHLFEAGSLKSTPTILPYREAYAEGYSDVRISF